MTTHEQSHFPAVLTPQVQAPAAATASRRKTPPGPIRNARIFAWLITVLAVFMAADDDQVAMFCNVVRFGFHYFRWFRLAYACCCRRQLPFW